MLKIYKNLKFLMFAAVFVFIPTTVLAGPNGGYTYYDDISSDWNYGSGGYSSPSYYDDSYDSGWNYGSGGYSSPSYYYDYSGGDYYGGGYDYPTYYGGSTGGSSYNPGYSYGGGSSYPIYNYSSSYTTPPSSNKSNSSSNSSSGAVNETNVVANSTANAVASSSNVNTNINNNNVYVYTNPQGTAVLQNPAFQRLDGYCIITPNNPRVGQTVTVTAYSTGGIGSYTYSWGGDIYYGSGPSTQFTSQTSGTKNISVTVRSGEEVMTRNCSVTFTNDNFNNFTSSNVSVSRSTTAGTPVSGVFVQPGTPVSGVYLNQLPATGVELTWIHYMIAFLALVLGTAATLIARSRKQLLATYR